MSRPDELGLEVIQFQKIRPSRNFSFIVLGNLGNQNQIHKLAKNDFVLAIIRIHLFTVIFIQFFFHYMFLILTITIWYASWYTTFFTEESKFDLRHQTEMKRRSQYVLSGLKMEKSLVTKWICSKSLIIDRAKLGIFLSGLGRVWLGVIFCPYWPFLPLG